MELNSELIDAFATKGFSLDWMYDENCGGEVIIYAKGLMSKVNIEIHFDDETDAKIWYENTFNCSI